MVKRMCSIVPLNKMNFSVNPNLLKCKQNIQSKCGRFVRKDGPTCLAADRSVDETTQQEKIRVKKKLPISVNPGFLCRGFSAESIIGVPSKGQ